MREFVYRLLHDPESLRRQTLARLEMDRAGLGSAEDEAAFLEGLLGLRVVAHKDGTLEVSGTFGERVLAPGEPRPVELPPPGYETGALSSVSDSQR